ncbi:hypothetical protein LR48_Vigan05g071500 [Vigna angularis]|uniref:Uncharacterized protein n=1 Tax=Phaseolus angularis TaxID=3914 RepID=A0A0L9UK98_PHAAN|nr:hypothetical protein LR48_Vigan05g071500 [Vigna angularis]
MDIRGAFVHPGGVVTGILISCHPRLVRSVQSTPKDEDLLPFPRMTKTNDRKEGRTYQSSFSKRTVLLEALDIVSPSMVPEHWRIRAFHYRFPLPVLTQLGVRQLASVSGVSGATVASCVAEVSRSVIATWTPPSTRHFRGLTEDNVQF